MFIEPGTTYVNKLRAASGAEDTLALRIRYERALAGARLDPPGLPASAILCVRKLRDPLPGGLRIESGSAQTPLAWERAVAESLDQLLKRAARPALGYVPLNAEAVVFLDRPEFLGCFASDWIEGSSATRWWWRSLFRTADLESLMRAWMEAPEYAPAALARLAVIGKAARFAGSLSEGDSRRLLSGIIRRFALRELASTIDAVLTDGGSPPRDSNAPPPQKARTAPALAHPPWRRWVKETDARQLKIGQESLLATGLMLVRAPATVRSRAYAEETFRWYRDLATTRADARREIEPAGAAPASDTDRGSKPERASGEVETRVDPGPEPAVPYQLPGPLQPSQEIDRQLNPDRERAGESDAAKPRAINVTAATGPGSAIVAPAPVEAGIGRVWESPLRKDASSRVAQPGIAEEFDVSTSPYLEPVFEAEVKTGFGGLFYLINVGLFLELYGDFTTPAQPGLELSIWDFVALVGRDLYGGNVRGASRQIRGASRKTRGASRKTRDASRKTRGASWQPAASHSQAGTLRHDPIWALLAQLAGRGEHDPPGHEFNPPGDWRLSAEWLIPFETQRVWQWESADDRLRVLHPDGFLVLDVKLEDNPVEQLHREMRDYSGVAGFEFCPQTSAVESGGQSTPERWLGWLMPYIRARLACALGGRADERHNASHVGAALRGRRRWRDQNPLSALQSRLGSRDKHHQPGAAAEGRPYISLLGHQARVVVTATHLDVYFSLQDHPIEIRLAGLDRNPGWVPAAGRYITFHYE